MLISDDSEDEQEIGFNNILCEDSKEEDVDYYNDNLPHINFYLKFQNELFLEIFRNELKAITAEAQTEAQTEGTINRLLTNSEKYEDKDSYIYQPQKQNQKEDPYTEEKIEEDILGNNINEIIKEETNSSNNVKPASKKGKEENLNILNECGFCIDYEIEEKTPEEGFKKNEIFNDAIQISIKGYEQNELEIAAQKEAADLYKRLEETFQNQSLHLNEHEEYTKKINFLFQANKNKFTFSIERELNNEERSKRCFICNQKKKSFNKVLITANIYLCYECKTLDNNFRMISLSKLVTKYCLNSNDLLKYEKQLIVLSTKNPRGYAKQMKLFFLFQIKEIAIRKHGTLLNTKNLYHSKILSMKKAKPPKKTIHKWKKTKSIYSKEAEKVDKQKIICDEDAHAFEEPMCIDETENLYKKNCKKCNFYIEYMQI